jgi:signal transduction histidine kinase
MVWLAAPPPVSAATRHVVMLFDERPSLPGLAVLEAQFVRALASGSADRIEVYREAMDLSRFSTDDYSARLRDFLKAKYADRKIDVAVAVMGPALDFLLSYGDEIFPGTPIVFSGVDRKQLGGRDLPPHVGGVVVNREYAPTLAVALALHPGTKEVVVVGGTSEFDNRIMQAARDEFRAYEDKVAFRYMTSLPLNEILTKLARLPPHTIVLYTTFFRDAAGDVFVPHDVAERVSSASSAPVYGFLDQFLGRGLVGGNLYSVGAHGMEAAKLVLRILAGDELSSHSASETRTSRLMFDWRQLQRWGISEARLPPGSEILFRPATAWELYQLQILSACAVVLVQAALLAWLVFEHGRRRRSEVAAHALSGSLINAQEEERSRLARELHDDVTQRLALLAIEAGREERSAASLPGGTAMRTMREGLVRLSEDVHALSYRLHPSILEDLGLTAALRSECERLSRTCAMRVQVDAQDVPENLPNDVALCLFRIAQEALRNTMRHAKASQVQVRLRRIGGGFELRVSDNGVGFDSARQRSGKSLGHASMQQRVFARGGMLEIESRPGHGTTILAWVPVRENGREPDVPPAADPLPSAPLLPGPGRPAEHVGARRAQGPLTSGTTRGMRERRLHG